MGHRHTIMTNLLVNQYTAYSDIAKLYTKYTLHKMLTNANEDVILRIGKNNFQIVGTDSLHLVINSTFKNYENELERLNKIVQEYFPLAEGTQMILEDEQSTPVINMFTNKGITNDLSNVKLELNNNTVVPYLRATYNTDMPKKDLNEIRTMLQYNDFTNAESFIKKYIKFYD